jgi:MarR-like DNA-binding transcriptional regulator SgrR of sgrS sRNA
MTQNIKAYIFNRIEVQLNRDNADYWLAENNKLSKENALYWTDLLENINLIKHCASSNMMKQILPMREEH